MCVKSKTELGQWKRHRAERQRAVFDADAIARAYARRMAKKNSRSRGMRGPQYITAKTYTRWKLEGHPMRGHVKVAR